MRVHGPTMAHAKLVIRPLDISVYALHKSAQCEFAGYE